MIPNYEIHALSQIKGIGPSRIRKICNSCKKLKSILELSESDFNKIEGIPKSVLNKINSIYFIGSHTTLNEHEERGIEYLTFFDAKYPKLLTTELVKNGFAIISGFARGVDFLAHKTTLELNGNTVGVFGNGLDICYSPENKNLYPKMWDSGAFISEYPLGHKAEAMYFPTRNRKISGLSLGTLVIEAGEKSGAIIIAYNALEQNRDVFAVPGRIDSKMSVGCNNLIKNGAKPVNSVDDILESFQFNLEKSSKIQLDLIPDLNKNEKLSHDPTHIDELVTQVNLNGQLVLSTLLQIEL